MQLDAARGESIDGVARVAGTSLDKGEQLDALAKVPISQQAILIAFVLRLCLSLRKCTDLPPFMNRLRVFKFIFY